MSDMLERAIIDAEALKEAATKNAETLVLEKYSNQIKDAVESLLEQDDPMAGLEAELTKAADTATPDTASAADSAKPAEKSSVMEHIPLAATSEDTDQVEIPLDKLMEEIDKLNESMSFAGPFDSVEEELYEDDFSLEEGEDDVLLGDVHEEFALGEGDLGFMEEEYGMMDDDLEEGYGMMDDDLEEGYGMMDDDLDEGYGMMDDDLDEDYGMMDDDMMEEEYDISEELLEDEIDEDIYEAIAEALEVDIHPQKSGWKGMPESMIDLAEEEILALEQDSEVREQRAAMRKAAAELQEANRALVGRNKNLKGSLGKASDLVTKLKEAVMVLDQKLAESSLKNAKLIYQNKALTSDSLNERQKRKLAEAVINAESIEEAKVIFETLQSTVGSTSRKKQPNSLSEAVQKTSSMILSSREKTSEGQRKDPTLNRWKFLAGIDN